MQAKILTNNPLVEKELQAYLPVDYRQVKLRELLELCRDEIHLGSTLLTHPLSGSIKPNQTPYKSVMLEKGEPGRTDQSSVNLIESAIAMTRSLMEGRPAAYLEDMPDAVRADYQMIDLTLIASALPSMGIHTPWA